MKTVWLYNKVYKILEETGPATTREILNKLLHMKRCPTINGLTNVLGKSFVNISDEGESVWSLPEEKKYFYNNTCSYCNNLTNKKSNLCYRCPTGKLTTDMVRSMRSDHDSGLSIKAISDKYNISNRHAYRIIQRLSWANVD